MIIVMKSKWAFPLFIQTLKPQSNTNLSMITISNNFHRPIEKPIYTSLIDHSEPSTFA